MPYDRQCYSYRPLDRSPHIESHLLSSGYGLWRNISVLPITLMPILFSMTHGRMFNEPRVSLLRV